MAGKKKKEDTPTVGKAAVDLASSTSNESYDRNEIERAVHAGTNSKKSYEEEIWETIENGRKDSVIKGDFYIIVLLKKERSLANVIRQYFFYRQTCPTPEYDQTVYKYVRDGDKLEYIWTVPDVETCNYLPLHRPSLKQDQLLLLSMIEAFNNGDLEKWAAKLNNEPKQFILL